MRNRLNKKIVMFFIFLVLTNFVYAQQDQIYDVGTYNLNEDAYLPQTCDFCSYVMIDNIILADKTNLSIGENMTKFGGSYEYILDSQYISRPGTYLVYGTADPNGVETGWNYYFKVNQLAISQTTSQGIGSAVFLILMIILMFSFAWVGFRLFKTDSWWILGIFLVFLASLLMIYNTWLGYQYHKLFTGLPDSSLPETIFWMLLMIIVLGLLVGATFLFLKWKKVLRYIKKEIRRKESGDEDLDDWDFDRWGNANWRLQK